MAPIPTSLAQSSALLSSVSATVAIPTIHQNLKKRWQFSGGRYQGAGASWNPGWDWTQPKGWTGSWEVGKLFMWTSLIFGCMLGGFLLIVFIFWSCGMVDDRRLKRRARKLAKRGPPMKEQKPIRAVNSKNKVTTPGIAVEERDDRADQGNKSQIDDEIDDLLLASSYDHSSICELIDLGEPVASCSASSLYDNSRKEDNEEAIDYLRDIVMEPIPIRQATDSPSDWSWRWIGYGSHESLSPDMLEPTPSSKGSTNFEDLTTGRQWSAANRASARIPDNSVHLPRARKSSSF